MAYLTYDEFKALTGKDEETFPKESFDKWLTKASAVLDSVTSNFYQFHDIETDPFLFRANRFKLALCSQICYFQEVGADTFEGINKAPQSVGIGSTSISNGSRYGSGGQAESKNLEAEDLYIYLSGTGLLYRGVDRC
ncbi:hypothetical protein [Enterococcus diestrammenae]|uniref:Phage protein n=1 Tax=Enterococcus diestrammenae TaxID=1155073 RepID=A0ABV0F2H3_9ENTE|nr:hypothetical protein [Enterococcus diestrammenae]KAF1297624.1 hypothetical protein BAU18_13140 [Enterococcus diestrammenae]